MSDIQVVKIFESLLMSRDDYVSVLSYRAGHYLYHLTNKVYHFIDCIKRRIVEWAKEWHHKKCVFAFGEGI
jgi:hypothetical protein